MRKILNLFFPLFLLAFLLMPNMDLAQGAGPGGYCENGTTGEAGACSDTAGGCLLGWSKIEGGSGCDAGLSCCKKDSTTEGNATNQSTNTGTGTGTGAGANENCNIPCPAGAVCFSNPLSVCSVKGLVMNILDALRGIVALIAIAVIVVGGIWYMASFGNDEAMKRAKMIIGAAVGGLALVLAAPSFVKEILTILQNNSMDPGDVDRALTVQQILLGVLNFLLSIVGLVAIIAMVIGGIIYLTSGGEEDNMKRGKKIFMYAIIGIIISIGSLIIVKQINAIFSMSKIIG